MTRRTRIKFLLTVVVASQLGCSSLYPVFTPYGCTIFGQIGERGPIIGIPIPFQFQAKAVLTGTQDGLAVETEATGEATFALSEDGAELTYDVKASDLSSPVTDVSFRIAPPGSEGAVALDVSDQVTEVQGEVSVTGTWQIHPVDLQALQRGNMYVELCTEEYPEGEIRGQVE